MNSCCEDPACSHAVMAAATVEASKLTDKEREIILGVLAKDEMLRRQQQLRVMRLKAELQSLRRKGALRPSASAEGDAGVAAPAAGRSCGRCRAELGRVINRGAACRACRLHVCKQCREYSHRATDWVCTVCHKHMEIQAASGEWMNEFVRRPSRRRDHKVYVPAADIIKRTIRRSWTISNPTPRWSALRSSSDHRPYNSLPRGQDISDYPSLVRSPGNRSPVRRTQSEDVYGDRPIVETTERKLPQTPTPTSSPQTPRRQQRINPLMALGDRSPERIRKTSPRRKLEPRIAAVDVDEPEKEITTDSPKFSPEISKKQPRVNPLMALSEKSPKQSRKTSPARPDEDENSLAALPGSPVKPRSPRTSSTEKRVSFEGGGEPLKLATTRAQSFPEGCKKEKKMTTGSRSLPEESSGGLREETVAEVHSAREDGGPVELCDIEPLSGTVFRKVTVRRRRQENMRKVAAVDTGWRRSGPDADILDILLPDGDDYRLVFLNSDSSSKEEELDDADSSSTASSFPIDECDWDYFEPGATSAAAAPRSVLSWASASPFGSPGVYRRGVGVLESPIGSPLVYRRIRESSDEDTTRLDSNSPSESLLEPPEHHQRNEKAEEVQCGHQIETRKETSCQTCGASTQNVTTTQYIPIPVPVPIPFPVPTVWAAGQDTLVLYGPAPAAQLARSLWQYVAAGVADGPPLPPTPAAKKVEEEESSSAREDMSSSTSGCSAEDSDSDDERKPRRFSKVFVVNEGSSGTSSSSSSSESDEDTDTELDCGVVLTSIKVVDSEGGVRDENNVEEENSRNSVLSEALKKREEESGNKTQKRRRRRNRLSNNDEKKDESNNLEEKIKEASSDNLQDFRIETQTNLDDLDSSETLQKLESFSEVVDSSDDEQKKEEEGGVNCIQNIQEENNLESSKSDVEELDSEIETIAAQMIEDDGSIILTSYQDNEETTKCASLDIQEHQILENIANSDVAPFQQSQNLENTHQDLGEATKSDAAPFQQPQDLENFNQNLEDVRSEAAPSQQPQDSEDSHQDLEDVSKSDVVPFQQPQDLENFNQNLEVVKNEAAPSQQPQDLEDLHQDLEDVTNSNAAASEQPKNMKNLQLNLEDTTKRDSAPLQQPQDTKNLHQDLEDATKSDAAPLQRTQDSEDLDQAPETAAKSDSGAARSCGATETAADGGEERQEEGAAGRPGARRQCDAGRHSARYTSLVMITQAAAVAAAAAPAPAPQVSVVTTDTTRVVADVVVRHTNGERRDEERKGELNNLQEGTESVTVITGGETLSAFEEGLADDDSWVENLSHDEEDDDDDDFETNSPTDDSSSGEEVTLTCSAALDQEDELRGYHRTAIDFTLHTIVEESCEESEVEQTNTKNRKERPASATDLEKYFFFGLGDGTIPPVNSNRTEDAFSETSSIYSEGMDSLGGPEEAQNQNNNENLSDPADLASSRLEKYFLSGFMGFTGQRRDSDGSVGSDSEGKPSPEQRRKRLVRARGSGRSHSSSLDNLLANPDLADQPVENLINSEDSSSSDSDTYDESLTFEKNDGQFDTVKRKKKKQKNSEEKNLETTQEVMDERDSDDEDGHKTPQPEILAVPSNLTTNKNQQSRDSGFIGSCDDLLKEQRENCTPELGVSKSDTKVELEKIEEKREERLTSYSTPPATSLTRKDSFNNWSSDEETNLMMCKMRQFFKTMVANSQLSTQGSKPSTPNLNRISPKPLPSPRSKNRCKPPQLLYFEDQLTKLMKTVPGIRDDQVREIVEYLSSEDTWSDSYDSSDYTSSDLEGTTTKSALQQQISDSCQQIINKFDSKNAEDEEGDEGDGGILDEGQGINKETAFVYQKLVASIEKMASGDLESKIAPHNSPPLIAKVMHHIGSRLVALMHEVSSGESHASNSPKGRHYHRRLQQKLSNASTTTTDDDSTSDSNFADVVEEMNSKPCNILPRSRSHDLLLSEARALHQSSSGVSDIAEERGEASDCERFSWRGSFESALLASDSRNRLSLIEVANVATTAAKRRSAGDLLFAPRSSSREQLDRVRSCGSIGEGAPWSSQRRSSVPDCGSGGSADGEDEDEENETRATLPRGLQAGGTPTTNSLPRLPTGGSSGSNVVMHKAQSMHHFLPQAKSARYRPPGFSRLVAVASGGPKRAVSAPGLQPSHQRRGRRSQQHSVHSDDVSVVSETAAHSRSSPTLATARTSKSATPSPAPSARRGAGSAPPAEWHGDDDVDRLVAMHQQRSSLSSLGLRSDSMASVYSGAGDGRYGSVAVRGQVEFGLQYNYKAGALEILVRQCRDLAPVDVKRNRSDPYVKVYLLPDKSKSGKRKTKVKKHTLNPVFEECLRFHISLNGLETRTLWLTVWHSDMFGRNDFLGEVTMALENKVFDDPTPKWYSLQERTEPFDDILSFKGDIIVCLKFVPPDMTVHKKGKRSRGTLHVLIKEAKALTAVKGHGHSDPFCKSYLLPDKGRSSKQKTPVAKRTVNPVWNHTFVYDDVTLQELAERCLELTVWDHDRLASNEFLGGVRFSLGTGKHYGKAVEWMDATGKELGLWKSMLERPNFWVEGCVALRPTLDTRAS